MYEDLLNLTKQSDPDGEATDRMFRLGCTDVSEDWEILNYQYFGQILYATAEVSVCMQ